MLGYGIRILYAALYETGRSYIMLRSVMIHVCNSHWDEKKKCPLSCGLQHLRAVSE